MQWIKRIFHVGPIADKIPVKFFNTLEKKEEVFSLPQKATNVRMYNCGPTVYDRQHIGNLSAAVFADTIRRVLECNGFAVKQVINITDFGHLSSDSDEGDDKMTKGLKREKMTLNMENMRALATKYMNIYLDDIALLNVAVGKIQFPRASDYVPAMIAIIQSLEEKGYAYKIQDGVYFDTARFPGYGALGGISENQEAGARVAVNTEKHSPHDFALWKSVSPRSKLGWSSPWGKGFPGWHLECSAMIHSILGDQIDIHTGGIEHIAIHHNNEIAQSEAATGKRPLSRFWLHREHIRMGNEKLAKSTGNVAYLSDLAERNIHPLSLRYWFLTAHYRQPANFTWEALEAAQKAYLRLREKYEAVKNAASENLPQRVSKDFVSRLNNDLDTPGAIATIWESIHSGKLSPGETRMLLENADRALGLGLTLNDEMLQKLTSLPHVVAVENLPENIQDLVKRRDEARSNKDWALSDSLRDELKAAGYVVEDSPTGTKLLKQ